MIACRPPNREIFPEWLRGVLVRPVSLSDCCCSARAAAKLSFVFCLLSFVFCLCLLSFVFGGGAVVFCLLSFVFCLLSFVFCFFVFCLWRRRFCLLSFVFVFCLCLCLLSFVFVIPKRFGNHTCATLLKPKLSEFSKSKMFNLFGIKSVQRL